ncbi:hypothetical protein CONCODRAFT_2856, partial [Conidiobolus coronatus NRRL 28638]
MKKCVRLICLIYYLSLIDYYYSAASFTYNDNISIIPSPPKGTGIPNITYTIISTKPTPTSKPTQPNYPDQTQIQQSLDVFWALKQPSKPNYWDPLWNLQNLVTD